MPEFENRTRRELSAALRELLREEPLDQLRVRELTERCGLRRQSFYYHFKDVYDLLAWAVRQERALLADRLAECLTWRQALLALLDRAGEEIIHVFEVVIERLPAVQIYYRDRCGRPPDRNGEERDRRRSRAMLLSLLEGWVRNEGALPPEELADALERVAERGAEGAVWQTLRERGEWCWTP